MNPLHHPSNFSRVMSRREMLRQAGLGFGAWALLDLLTRAGFAAGQSAIHNPKSAIPTNPLAG